MYQVRSWLSEQIAPLHAEVDRRAGEFDLAVEAGADALTRFLAIGIHDLESGLDAADAASILPEYAARMRGHLMPLPVAVHPVPLHSAAEVWGALYVLEGSRLGARWLARQSDHLRKNTFFAEDEPAFWPIFLTRLDEAAAGGAGRAGMLAGAEAAFGAFLRVHPAALDAAPFVDDGRFAEIAREVAA